MISALPLPAVARRAPLRSRAAALVLIAGAVIATRPSAPAQVLGGLWKSFGEHAHPAERAEFGRALAPFPDLDGDGCRELLVGAPGGMGHRDPPGEILLLSGRTGTLLWSHGSTVGGSRFGAAVAVGSDLDGDLVREAYVVEPWFDLGGTVTGRVHALSGSDGQTIWTTDLPGPLSRLSSPFVAVDDLNGDGIIDLACGDLYASGWQGAVHLISGADGSVLLSILGGSNDDSFGYSLARCEDADGDGLADLLVGIPDLGASRPGTVELRSSASGGVIAAYPGIAAGDEFGRSVAGLPDLDGDGFPELFVGAPRAPAGPWAEAGQAVLLSGASGVHLSSYEGERDGGSFGSSVGLAGDLDGDGSRELLIGAVPDNSDAAELWVIHRSGHRYLVLRDGLETRSLGSSFADAGDLDGDGLDDFATGAPNSDRGGFTRAGAVLLGGLDRLIEADAVELSAASGGVVQFWLDFPESDAGLSFQLLGSLNGTGPIDWNGLAVPLSRDPLLIRMRDGGRLGVFTRTSGILNWNGDAHLYADVPPGHAASLVGRRLVFASVSYRPPDLPSASTVAWGIEVTP